MGKRFKLRIDHFQLKYLLEQYNLNETKERWLQFLCEFDFEMKHAKGKESKVVDALSRKMHVMHAAIVSTCKLGLKSKILEAFILDGYIYK